MPVIHVINENWGSPWSEAVQQVWFLTQFFKYLLFDNPIYPLTEKILELWSAVAQPVFWNFCLLFAYEMQSDVAHEKTEVLPS